MDARVGSSESDQVWLWMGRIGLLVALGLAWQSIGWFGDSSWTSTPAEVARRLLGWLGADLWLHVGTTLFEMLVGLVIGVPLGAALGLLLGRTRTLGALLRPIMFSFYNVPIVAVAPLLILWFGLGLMPKVVLVALVTFFLLFFSTFAGAQAIDKDLINVLRLMGASGSEQLKKVYLPASAVWIASGLRLALPYALIDAVVGEILASSQGVGFLLTSATSQIDMTGVYAALVVLMVMGVGVMSVSQRIERRVLGPRSAVAEQAR